MGVKKVRLDDCIECGGPILVDRADQNRPLLSACLTCDTDLERSD